MVWSLGDVQIIFKNDTVLVRQYQVFSTTARSYTIHYDFHRETRVKKHLNQTFMFSLIKYCNCLYKHVVHKLELSAKSFHEARHGDIISIREFEFLSHTADIIDYIEQTSYMQKQSYKHVRDTLNTIHELKERIDGSKAVDFTNEIILYRTGYLN